MNQARMAAALNTIAVAFGELAEAIGEAGLGSPRTETFTANPGPIGAVTVNAPEFPPFAPEEDYEAVPLPADAPGLGRCPTHNLTWTVKAAGVSKAGKAYNAFFRCDGKDQDGAFCQKRPTKAWADAHPL